MAKFQVRIDVKENGKTPPGYSLQDDMNGEFTLRDLESYVRAALISVAEDTRKEEQAMGFDKNPRVMVDSKEGKSVFEVRPFGRIEYIARQNINDIIIFAFETVLNMSKVDSGQYKRSNVVAYNGNPVATDMAGLKSWLATNPTFSEKDRVRLVNTVPYARKLEYSGISAKGKSGRRWSKTERKSGRTKYKVMIPNGAYTIATRAIKQKYKKNVGIKFEFMTGVGLGGISGHFLTGTKSQRGRPYLYPTILLSISEAGITQ